MMNSMDTTRKGNPRWLYCCARGFPFTSTPTSLLAGKEADGDDKHGRNTIMAASKPPSHQRKPGGWKSMPFILGNETFERLAWFGVFANFLVYLKREYHMDQVFATNLINMWSAVTNFAPLIGAFISDAYTGRFWAITVGSVASSLGILTITLTAWIPSLRPPPCPVHQQAQCTGPNSVQLGVLLLGSGLLSIGTGGIRPCSIPFGVDQFDFTTEEGRRGINSYYNWYYTTFSLVVFLALTVVVYVQDSISWVLGFGIPTILMFGSIILFFLGTKFYVYFKPTGSIFSSIAQVFVAAYKKRHLELLNDSKAGVYYDPPLKGIVVSKLPLTNQFSFLNKAAIIVEGELNPEGTPSNKWSLCSIQQIEEVKCLIKVLPIWASGIICFTAMVQQGTFVVSQALSMDRHLGPKFQIPPGSVSLMSMIVVGIFVPIYDRILVPCLRRITKHEEGITLLQRMGIGLVFSILSMVVAGLFEHKRRALANSNHNAVAPMSVLWLSPQLILLGFAEAFNFIGQIEFYNQQFPENMRSIATSLFFCSISGANYLSSLVVSLVHGLTGRNGKPDWLTNDINQGRVDYFYYLLAGLGVINLVYFMLCARKYRYKSVEIEQGKPYIDLELNLVKH
ncbi:hypothetical protein Ancab_020636 [Ancistrocladus abbreviatus]